MLLSTLIIALVSPAWSAPTPSREQIDIARLARIAKAHDASPRFPDTHYRFHITRPRDCIGDIGIIESGRYRLPHTSAPLPQFMESDAGLKPPVYAPYAEYFDTLQEAIESMNIFIAHPPSARFWLGNPLDVALNYFGFHHIPTPAPEVKEIEIVGHGLGSVLALLSTLAIHQAHPALNCKTALFSMPRIGDDHFAQYVNDLLDKSDQVDIQRLTYGRDPLPSLPPPHYGLVHPSSIREVLLETEDMGREGMKGKLEDGFGPYWGQTIGLI